ncbi:MAG: hypothetical protein OQK75_11210 [Gammaproteobacteria bacterium]|nr:hypothetical protein [Gammaproteobacteria bacterium]
MAFDSGEIQAEAFINWAIHKLENGEESQSLNELACITNPIFSEERNLFIHAVAELGGIFPPNNELKTLVAIKIAENIVKGIIDANQGCTKIAEISRELESPDILAMFELLSHEQYNHEGLGITAENTKPSIIEEAKKLINKT